MTSTETRSALALLRTAVEQAVRAGEDADALGVLAGLQAAQEATVAALRPAVRDGRRHGLSWRWIGKALRLSPQGAQQRYAEVTPVLDDHCGDPAWAQARAHARAVLAETRTWRPAPGVALSDQGHSEDYAQPPRTPPGRPDLAPPASVARPPVEVGLAAGRLGQVPAVDDDAGGARAGLA